MNVFSSFGNSLKSPKKFHTKLPKFQASLEWNSQKGFPKGEGVNF